MELTKYKIGELIELTNEKNANGLYGEDDAIGVNIDKKGLRITMESYLCM